MTPTTTSERLNTLTHFVGLCLTASIAWMLLWMGYAKNWEMAFGATFFTVGLLMMYIVSSLYHWWNPAKKGKRILRILDHISIYVLIASSYTPICMALIEDDYDVSGWLSFGIIWTLAIAGIFMKIFLFERFSKISVVLYLLLGWSILFFIQPVRECVSLLAIIMIILEGIAYTSGVYFFLHDTEPQHPYYHGIWHIFVILGTLFHWAAVFIMTLVPGTGDY